MKKRKFMGKKTVKIDDKEYDIILLGYPTETDSGFTKVFYALSVELAIDKELSGNAARLLHYIMATKLRYGSAEFGFNAQQIAEDLNVSDRTVYRWKGILVKKGILEQITPSWLKINANMFFKGRVRQAINAELSANKVLSELREKQKQQKGGKL